MSRGKYILSLTGVLFMVMLLVSGGTFAYWSWSSANTLQTNVIVKVEDGITMTINPTIATKTGMYPTNDCDGNASMMSSAMIAINNSTGVIARPTLKLKIKITDVSGNDITDTLSAMDANDGNNTTNKKYRYYVRYAVAETDGNCTTPLKTGRFDSTTKTKQDDDNDKWFDSSDLGLSFIAAAADNIGDTKYTDHSYKVWIWIDSEYTTMYKEDDYKEDGTGLAPDLLRDATITVTWSENSTVGQVPN